jgi:hypothetical protein
VESPDARQGDVKRLGVVTVRACGLQGNRLLELVTRGELIDHLTGQESVPVRAT